ncbi:hypothetical protein ACLSU7_07640 [Bdellovibrio sp. HCB185ZH]|uniref:hypothetical protein n=1 Tax=Bdellovibrio sp. HCB185ZH TaxID=3394235 RepID=UPI0039A75978
MKSLLIALSILVAAPAFAFQVMPYEGNGGDEPQSGPTEFISWCDKKNNSVLMVRGGQIVTVDDCNSRELTCMTTTVTDGYRSRVTALCR